MHILNGTCTSANCTILKSPVSQYMLKSSLLSHSLNIINFSKGQKYTINIKPQSSKDSKGNLFKLILRKQKSLKSTYWINYHHIKSHIALCITTAQYKLIKMERKWIRHIQSLYIVSYNGSHVIQHHLVTPSLFLC